MPPRPDTKVPRGAALWRNAPPRWPRNPLPNVGARDPPRDAPLARADALSGTINPMPSAHTATIAINPSADLPMRVAPRLSATTLSHRRRTIIRGGQCGPPGEILGEFSFGATIAEMKILKRERGPIRLNR